MFNCPLKGKCRLIQGHGENPEDYAQYGLAGHNGIDLADMIKGKKKTLYAPFNGRIVVSGTFGDYGLCVRLVSDEDAGNNRTELTLGHFDSIDPAIRTGQLVKLGQVLGVMGMSGHATGVHVHIQLRILSYMGVVLNYDNGFKGSIDPIPYMLMWEHNNESPLLVRV